jgi:hypothetical protein
MNILLWILQGLAAVIYAASGVMKVFMFERISAQDRSFAALPRRVWAVLGILELVRVVGLIVPGVLHWQPALTGLAAVALTLESLVFIAVHARYRELTPIVLSAVLGLVMAFVAYGRMVLTPLF